MRGKDKHCKQAKGLIDYRQHSRDLLARLIFGGHPDGKNGSFE